MNNSESIPQKIDIVAATPEDARAFEEVTRQSWLETFPNEEHHISRADIEERFADMDARSALLHERMQHPKDRELYLLAKRGNEVLGVCRLVMRAHENEIQNFFILPAQTGRGIGRQLWNQALKLSEPGKELMLRVATYNAEAIEFWKHLGFEETGDVILQPLGVKSGASRPMMKMVRVAEGS